MTEEALLVCSVINLSPCGNLQGALHVQLRVHLQHSSYEVTPMRIYRSDIIMTKLFKQPSRTSLAGRSGEDGSSQDQLDGFL